MKGLSLFRPSSKSLLFAVGFASAFAFARAGSGAIVINEIMYHPSDSNTGGDWLELLNTGPSTVDLEGYRFTSGITLEFAPGTLLAAGAYLVIASDESLFSLAYAFCSCDVIGAVGNLSNGGETIVLIDDASMEVDRVEYSDAPPWNSAADGSGPSLELFDAALDNNLPGSWLAGVIDGTPGATNFVSVPAGPVISNVDTDPNNPLSGGAVKIQAQVQASTTFCSVTLFYSTGAAFMSKRMHFVSFNGRIDGEPFQYQAEIPRQPARARVDYYIEAVDADGVVTLSPEAAPAQTHEYFVESKLAGRDDVIINEIMYLTSDGSGLQYVELFNNSANVGQGYAVDLSNWTIEVDGAMSSTRLPAGTTTLLSGEYLVLASDLAAFDAAYSTFSRVIIDPAFALLTGGDRIRIRTANGKEIDDVTFSAAPPWPVGAGGTGPSLELISPKRRNNDPANWTVSLGTGTPGEANSVLDLNEGPDLANPSHFPKAPTSADSIIFSVEATDDGGLDEVRLHTNTDGGMVFDERVMLAAGGDRYETSRSFASGSTVRYYFSATDAAGSPRTDTSPDSAPLETHLAFVSDSQVVAGTVVINELMYRDADNDLNLEFIELINLNPSEIDIGGWTLDDQDGGEFTFPSPTLLAAGATLAVVADSIDFAMGFPAVTNFIGAFGGDGPGGNQGFDLSNQGERVRLRDLNGIEMDSADYDSEGPWPRKADGRGSSLERIEPMNGGGEPRAWVASLNAGGTPGAANSLALDPASDLVITEISYHPLSAGAESEHFELHNRGSSAIDLNGWMLHEGADFTFGGSDSLAPGEFAVVARDLAGIGDKFDAQFAGNSTQVFGPYVGSLSNRADRVTIVDPAAGLIKDLVLYEDNSPWPPEADGTGPSLELIAINSDNTGPANWALSSGQAWQKVEFSGGPGSGTRNLVFFMAGTGEVLIDDISLEDADTGTPSPLANGAFGAGIAGWAKLNGQSNNTGPTVISHVSADGHTANGAISLDHTDNGTRFNMRAGARASVALGSPFQKLTFWFKVVSGDPILYVALTSSSNDAQASMSGGILEFLDEYERSTAGFANSAAEASAPPLITKVKHRPKTPAPGELVTVTAKVASFGPVQTVELIYDANGDGTADPVGEKFQMRDDGMLGDKAAGDGEYTLGIDLAALGLPSKTVVRYFVLATPMAAPDKPGRYPLAGSIVPTEAFFIFTPDPGRKVPHFFIQLARGDFLRIRSNSLLNDSNIHWDDEEIGAFVGQEEVGGNLKVFDKVQFRFKGGPLTRRWDKPNFKVRFPKGRAFMNADTLNINTSFYSLPEGGTRRARREYDFMSNTLFGETGQPHNEQTWVRVDMDLKEGAGFLYYGLFLSTEQLDSNFLERVDRDPNGNLYKADGFGNPWVGEFVSNIADGDIRDRYTKESNRDSSHDDVIALLRGLNNLSGTALEDHFAANFDMDALANYFAVYSIIQHWDGTFHNHMFYHDINGDGLWEVFPFDIDRSWGETIGYRTWAIHPLEGTAPFHTTFRYNLLMTSFMQIDRFRAQYFAQLEGLLDNVFTRDHLDPIIDAMVERIGDDTQGEIADDIALWMTAPQGLPRMDAFTVDYDIGGVLTRDYIDRRGDYLRGLLPKNQTLPASPDFMIQAESHGARAGIDYGATAPAAGSDGAIDYVQLTSRGNFTNYLVTGLPQGEYRATLRWSKAGSGSTDLFYRADPVDTSGANNLSGWSYAGGFTGRTGSEGDWVATRVSRPVFIPGTGDYTFKLRTLDVVEAGFGRTNARLDYFTLERIGDAIGPDPRGRLIQDQPWDRNSAQDGAAEGTLSTRVETGTDTSDVIADGDSSFTRFRNHTGSIGAGGWIERDIMLDAGTYRPVMRGASNFDWRAKLTIDGADAGIFIGSRHGARIESGSPAVWVDALLDTEFITIPNTGVHTIRVSEVIGTAFFGGFIDGATALLFKNLLFYAVPDELTPSSSAAFAQAATNASPIPVAFTASDPGDAGLASVSLFYRFADGPWIDTGLSSAAASGTFDFVPPSGEGVYGFATIAIDGNGNVESLPSVADAETIYDVTPPELACPGAAAFFSPSSGGLSSLLDPIDAFLDSFAAADNLALAPLLSSDAPAIVPLGDTLITFTAVDDAGNSAQCSVAATVTLNTRATGAWRFYD